MRNKCSRLISVMLVVVMLLGVLSFAPYSQVADGDGIYAYAGTSASQQLAKTKAYILKNVQSPTVASIGGEWTVIGLARSKAFKADSKTEKAIDNYYKNACSEIKKVKGELSTRKYTEYSRVILALSAVGKDPSNVAGYNLLAKLADFDKVTMQGVNGAIFALIALDSKDYDIPKAATGVRQTTRELLIAEILKSEVSGGGFALSGDTIDIDVTAMALQALAPYRGRANVSSAVSRAISALSEAQQSSGGFSNYGEASSETCAQAVVALCTLGINPNTDKRFVKSGKSVLDALTAFAQSDGSFEHVKGGGSNLMATEQAFYALAGYERFINGLSPIYDMDDVSSYASGVSVHIDRSAVHFTSSSGYPFIDTQSRVQVPLRAVMEVYGCDVSWDAKNGRAILKQGDTTVYVPVGSRKLTYKKGTQQAVKTVVNDTEAVIINGRIYIPIRAAVELLGGSVSWNSEKRSVVIER